MGIPQPIPKLVLLPGLDGTGRLFSDLINYLPEPSQIKIVPYPTAQFLAYSELEPLVRAACPASAPFVLIAESFSTPLAIKFAAGNPPNLLAMVLCAGFMSTPVQGWRRKLAALLAPMVFRIPLNDFATRRWLVGRKAPPSLMATVREAISTVQPNVLSERFRAVLACDVRTELGRVAVPILYLQAKQDRLVSASDLRRMRVVKPSMIVAIIDGPHLLCQREPQRAAEAIVAFIRSCRRSGIV